MLSLDKIFTKSLVLIVFTVRDNISNSSFSLSISLLNTSFILTASLELTNDNLSQYDTGLVLTKNRNGFIFSAAC